MKASSKQLSECVRQDLGYFLNRGPEGDWRCFAAEALMASLLKKNVEELSPEADRRAQELFLKVNEELRQSVLEENLYDDYLIGELRDELYRFWWKTWEEPVVSDFHQLFLAGGVGPGKARGCEHDDLYSKLFCSHLTLSKPALYRFYRESLRNYPMYDAAEKCRAEYFGEYRVIEHSTLSFVPKRYDISRTVCPETVLNMFYQLGFGVHLEERLREFYAIDLATQPDFNREMARIGSVDGSYATIDLSSASDSMSKGVLKQILPPSFWRWLNLLRTTHVTLPDGRRVELQMVSTMGNGFTFPLETMLFAAVVVVCYRLTGLKAVRNHGKKHGNWAVFGDDIIVKREAFSKVIRLLHLLGFKVNTDKTFVEGPFRESCGCDWFEGHMVRGVYIKRLTTQQDRYVAINLLNDWTAQTGIHLSSAVQYLLRTVKRVQVPPSCGAAEGIHVPRSMAGGPRDSNGAYKFRYFRAVPSKDRVGRRGRVGGRSLINPDGLELAFIAGHIRSQAIGRRQRSVRYVEKHGVTPAWDTFHRTSQEVARDALYWDKFRRPLARSSKRISFRRWETAVYFNMYS